MSGARAPAKPAWLEAFPSAQVRDLDPRRHALIEASAGTGKTFAIEHLVLRLLVENPDWKPEEILLLSFTERTVADLRRRIRTLFRRQLRADADGKAPIAGWGDAERARIHDLWLHADDLSVHTLHGFCQSTLLRDPILHDALLRAEVAADRDLADDALEDLLRGAWARDPGRLARLRDALGIDAKDDWRARLVDLALGWHPWREDRLVPERDDGSADRLEAEADAAVQRLRDAVEAVERGSFPASAFRATFKPTKTAQNDLRKHAYNKVLAQFEEWRLAPPDPSSRNEAVFEFFRTAFTKASRVVKATDGWQTELPAEAGTLPEWRELAEACAVIRPLSEQLADARRLRDLAIRAEAAMELRGAFEAAKIRLGRISYDDMPRNLALALRRGPAAAARIARRYKACIVDEFQDTDPLQWEILQHLCLQDAAATTPALPLFLVGDPKQAIYAFRGGDLPTYLAARKTFRDLAAEGRAQGFGLEANFRSRPALIAGLNAAFARPEWFGAPVEAGADPAWQLAADSGRVHFAPARAGRADASGDAEPCIFLRDFSGMSDPGTGKPANKKDVDHAVRRWIAARIVGLLEGGTPASDIAILVRKNSEGLAMERALRRRGIPCRIRRRGGAFHGAQADALRLLLEWIDDASDPDAQARILLLPFARGGAGDFPRGRPAQCPPLVARWAQLARAGRWPEFFDSVLQESGYLEALEDHSPTDAGQLAALARRLGEAGSAPGVTTHALRARFDAWRRGENGEDEGEEGGESSDDSVSILTLHMSKGLEFPRVFLAATGDGRKPERYALRDPETPGFRIALDLADAEDKARFEQQVREEDLRLFYVALTRAADALYVPLLPPSGGNRRYGALGAFAAEALRAVASDPATATLFARDEEDVHDRMLPRGNDTTARQDDPPPAENLQAGTQALFHRRRLLSSYSRLAHRAGTPDADAAPVIPSEPLLEEDGTRAERQESVPENVSDNADEGATGEAFSAGNASPGTHGISATELPPGSAVGTALHALLEHTPFASARDTRDPAEWLDQPGQRARVEEILRRESVDPACAPAAARAVWNALRMPIPDPADDAGATFRLADLAPEDLRHEVEFLLPFGADAAAPGAEPPEGVAWKRSGSDVFLWGFIDLVFRYQGRYYLLDWKSNLLPSYDRAAVERSMAQHRYDLQWKLYSVALDRWLASRLPGYDPERDLGGVCYLYLRGASEHGPFSGFVARPAARQLRAEYPAELAAILRKPAENAP